MVGKGTVEVVLYAVFGRSKGKGLDVLNLKIMMNIDYIEICVYVDVFIVVEDNVTDVSKGDLLLVQENLVEITEDFKAEVLGFIFPVIETVSKVKDIKVLYDL